MGLSLRDHGRHSGSTGRLVVRVPHTFTTHEIPIFPLLFSIFSSRAPTMFTRHTRANIYRATRCLHLSTHCSVSYRGAHNLGQLGVRTPWERSAGSEGRMVGGSEVRAGRTLSSAMGQKTSGISAEVFVWLCFAQPQIDWGRPCSCHLQSYLLCGATYSCTASAVLYDVYD